MIKSNDPNRANLLAVARQLGELSNRFVFIGGAVVGLLINDPAAPPVRPTLDIDVVVAVTSIAEFYSLQEKLGEAGFKERAVDTYDPICRYYWKDYILDVMPDDASILGFSNRWYSLVLKSYQVFSLDELKLKVISPPCFLAAKLEAFQGRGDNDFMGSRDMEDIISVLDGRSKIVDEVEAAHPKVRDYLSETFTRLLKTRSFIDAIAAHTYDDELGSTRRPLLDARLRSIASLAGR